MCGEFVVVCDVCLLITQTQHRGRKDLGRYGVSIK